MSDSPTPPRPQTGWPKAVPLLLLAGAVAYANALNTAFVFDDRVWIDRSPIIGDAAAYLNATRDRALTYLTVLVNHRLGGLNPFGYHLFNVAVHLAAGVTLFALLRRVFRLPRWAGRFDGRADGLAFAAALLWLVHPINTSAVTYVIQRAEALMGLFFLLTFYCWTRGVTDGNRRLWHPLAVFSFLACCVSKEVAVAAPPLLLLYDRVFLARSWREVLGRWPGWVGIFGLLAVKLWPVLFGAFAQANEVGVGFNIRISPKQYALTQTGVILHYLRLCVWPVGQSVDYFDWPLANSLADVAPAAVGLALLLAASGVALVARPAVGFLAAWFFVILAPTSSVMPIVDVAFEHRMYLSSITVLLGAVVLVDELLRRWTTAGPARRAVGVGLLTVAAGLFTLLTAARNTVYRSEVTFWASALRQRPDNYRAKVTLAALHTGDGRLDAAAELFDSVAPEMKSDRLYRLYRAGWHLAAGRNEVAIQIYDGMDQEQWQLKTRLVAPPYIRVLLAEKRSGKAVELARRLVAEYGTSAEYQFLLAAAELAAGESTNSAAAGETATRLDPAVVGRFAAEARALYFAKPPASARAGQLEQAYLFSAVACRATPTPPPEWFDTLALAAARTGRFPEAVTAAERGVEAADRAGDATWKAALHDRLTLYQAGKVYGPND